MKKGKFAYDEALRNANIALTIPTTHDGRKLSTRATADVILLQVHYQGIHDDYQKALQEVYKKAAPEEYGELSAQAERMASIARREEAHRNWKEGESEGERPQMPTAEELAQREEWLSTKEAEYKKMAAEVDEAVNAAAEKKGAEEVPGNADKRLPREVFDELVGLLGTDSEVELMTSQGQKMKMPSMYILRNVAHCLVED